MDTSYLTKEGEYKLDVTPEVAEAWLRFNTRNRNLSPTVVKRYVSEMKSGNWEYTGDTIRFDVLGRMLDGQHRLTAVVLAGVTIKVLLVTGLAPSVFDKIDTGKQRTGVDVLEAMSVKDSRRVAAALAVVSMYDRGVKSNVRDHVRTGEMLSKLADYPDMPESTAELKNNNTKLMPGSVFDGYYYVFRRLDQPLAKIYMTALRDGTGVEQWKSWHNLRERLIRNSTDIHKFDEAHIAALIIKGWNYARTGRDCSRTVWSPDKEEFPLAY